MGDKLIKTITGPFIRVIIAVIIILAAVAMYYDFMFGVYTLAAGVVLVAFSLVARHFLRKWTNSILQSAVVSLSDAATLAAIKHPLPICIVGNSGVIVMASDTFRELYPATITMKSSLSEIIGLRFEDLRFGNDDKNITLNVREMIFKIEATMLDSSVLLCLVDITNQEDLRRRYTDERKCFAHIQIDNYDALMSSSPDDKKSLIAAGIEKTIRQWAAKMDAAVVRYYTSKYFLVFDYKHYQSLVEMKFSILDEVRKIETDADFPVSLSIGVGVGGLTPLNTDEYSSFALDLALGRGGDQAVVKRGSVVDYYGGKIQVIENRNKGKSRIMAHALRQLIDQSSKVIIMGHKFPDIDSFASAIGVARITMNLGKEAHIVINDVNQSLEDFYSTAYSKGDYNFIKPDVAMEIVDSNSLLVIVDTNRSILTEVPKLIGKTVKTVVFDHHRKTAEPIEATLTYMDPSASSTAELITEVIQFISDKKNISRFEAELLLGGIIVDTNSFSVKTGMRTFEAAAWLRGKGADTSVVRQYLQNDLEDYKQRADIISKADFSTDGIAISKNARRDGDTHIIIAQAADDLLDIKGIRASFVLGEIKSEVVISARSLGEINVQKIMEMLGGGGHLTMAAAQLRNVTLDEAVVLLKSTIKEVLGDH